MHNIIHVMLPPWLGVVLLVLGLAVLLTSPKIVGVSMLILERLHKWFLSIAAEVSGVRYTLSSDSLLWKGARFSYWFVTLIAWLVLASFGTLILLNAFRLHVH
jgi:hypothetical protein